MKASRPTGQLLCAPRLYLLLLALALPTQGENIEVAVLPGGKLDESHTAEVDVSGSVILGVMVSGAHRGLNEDLLVVPTVDNAGGPVCLKVTSRDGAYTSNNVYARSGAAPLVRLPYASTMPTVLETYTGDAGHIAILASPGDCGTDTVREFYVPAELDTERGAPMTGPLTVFVNGMDATDVYFRLGEGEEEEYVDCSYIEDGRHTAFNFSCSIAADSIAAAQITSVQLYRERYGRELPSLQFNLLPLLQNQPEQ